MKTQVTLMLVLVGEHELTGVDFGTAKEEDYPKSNRYCDCQVVNFTLDGKTYTACEDPDDGYRSSMRYLRAGDTPTTNVFAPVKVIGRMKPDGKYEDGNEILELVDCTTGKTVIEVGTENKNDYYPCWVANFHPENMACNQKES
jgi:hypothetical protein